MDGETRPRKLQKIEDPSVVALEERRPVAANSPEARADDHSSAHEDDGEPSEQDNACSSNDASTKPEAGGSGLSKNQLKKLKRRQEWEAGREARKQKRKETRRAKKERQHAAKAEQAQGPTGTGENAHGATAQSACTRTKSSRGRSVLLPITVLLDCDFDDLMMEKEIISLESQITRCYSDNTKAPYRAQLVISSFNKKLKERFDTVFNKQYEQWKGVTITGEDYISAAGAAQTRMRDRGGGSLEGPLANQTEEEVTPEKGEIIYLTSDSPNTLTELRPYNTYVIGALVDKNRHKGICYKRAMSSNVKTARLPIGDYMQMASRSVLTTNHVMEIMLKWLQLGDWGEAFSLVMPKRKGARLKTDDKEGREAEEREETEETDKPGGPADEANGSNSTVVTSATPEAEAC